MNENKTFLRKADLNDRDLLLEWANDKDVRMNSFNHGRITYEEHEKWFLNKLNEENCLLYIYIYDNVPIGQIRVDIDGTKGWINYSVDKNYRNQGHGKKMLSLLEDILIRECSSIKYLCAKVIKSNISSRRKFEQRKYQIFENDNYTEYTKNLLLEKDEL